jgi:hypothetical protein
MFHITKHQGQNLCFPELTAALSFNHSAAPKQINIFSLSTGMFQRGVPNVMAAPVTGRGGRKVVGCQGFHIVKTDGSEAETELAPGPHCGWKY